MFVDAVVDLPAPVREFVDRTEHRLLIGGHWGQALSGKTLDVNDPTTGRRIASVPDAGEEDIDHAVRAARRALDGEWAQMLPADRTERMLVLANLIAERSEDIAHLEALEQGKLLEFARMIEVDMAVDYVRYMAGWATKIEGSTIDLSVRMVEGPRYHAFTRREPVGVIAGIVPWNFPHLMAIWKIAPALATGCTIVLKPAEETPLTALLLGELICEARFPDGVVNIVTGFGESTGAALVRHPGVDKVAFTGSTAVGKQIGVEAMRNMTRVSLELGGKSPVLVLDDIGTDFIAPGMIGGLFFNSGQQCVAGSRLYAPKKRFDEVVGRVADMADYLRLGSPFDPNVHIGPLVSKAQQERVLSYIESGREEGAEVVVGGKAPDGPGYFVEPTVVVNADHDMKIVREEVFGPILVAIPYEDLDDLVLKANDTDFGLAASIWSQNISRVLELIPRIKAGTIWVNTHSVLDANMPFGGFKLSGMGREHGRAAIEEYTETKTVCIAY